MKKLVISICTLALSAVLLGASTFAWFSMNRSVSASGMKVKAESSQSLVISNSTPVGTSTSVTFTSATAVLSPCTYNGGKLVYYSGASVDAQTGVRTGGTETDATVSNNYTEFTVYIASSGGEITGTLTASLSDDTLSAMKGYFGKCDTMSAIKIRFSVDGTDKGEISFAEQDGTFSAPSVTLVNNDIIPQNTSGSIAVKMTIYFDGEQDAKYFKTKDATVVEGKTYYTLDTSTSSFEVSEAGVGDSATSLYEKYNAGAQKYVHTNSVNTNELNIGVKFDLA